MAPVATVAGILYLHGEVQPWGEDVENWCRTDGRQLGQVALDALCTWPSIRLHGSTSPLPCHHTLVLAMSQDCDFRNTTPSACSYGLPHCKAIHRAGDVRVRWVLPSLCPYCKAIHQAGDVGVRWVLPSLCAFTHKSLASL